MKTKVIKFDDDARKSIQSGINTVSKIVSGTMGPKGRNVCLDKAYETLIINDGVSIVKEIELKDPFENVGVKLVKQVAEKTNTLAGDGTSTSVLLTSEILNQGIKCISSGANGIQIKKGIDQAVKDVIKTLEEIAIPVSDDMDKIKQIATISANDEKVGDIIIDAVNKVGIGNKITLEDSKTNETYVDVVDGFRFDKGYVSPYLATDMNKGEAVYENPYIMILDDKLGLNNIRDLQAILETVILQRKPLVLIADDYSPEVIEALVVNKLRNIIQIVAVKSPNFGENKKNELADIAVFTGAKVITPETGMKLKDTKVDMFGTAKKVTVTKDDTVIMMGNGDKEVINERCKLLEEKLDEETSEYNRAKIEDRLAKLKGKIGIIYVGGNSETEQKELKLRVEDAVNASSAAMESGIVAGGGSALTYCASKIYEEPVSCNNSSDYNTGYDIVLKALTKPLWKIADNSGLNAELVVANVYDKQDKNYGVNAITGEYGDMIDAGIVDPVKVTITALKNAGSIAGMILTSNAIIVDEPEKECKCCD